MVVFSELSAMRKRLSKRSLKLRRVRIVAACSVVEDDLGSLRLLQKS